MGARIIYNAGINGIKVYDCSAAVQSLAGTNNSLSITLDGPNNIVLQNDVPVELSFQVYNSLGFSDLYPTIIVKATNRPVPNNSPVSISTLEYNRNSAAASGLTEYNYPDNIPATATVLFNKFTDLSNVILNYKIYRAIQDASGIVGPFSLVATTYPADVSGNQQPNGAFYTYKSNNYDFNVIDTSNISINTKYVYKVSASNNNGEGLKSANSTFTTVGSKASGSVISAVGASAKAIITITTLPLGNGFPLNGSYIVAYTNMFTNDPSLSSEIALNVYDNTLTVPNLQNNNTYNFKVYGISNDINNNRFYGLVSNTVTAIPFVQPAAPEGLTAVAVDASNNATGKVYLTWDSVSGSNSYSIYRTDVSLNLITKITGAEGITSASTNTSFTTYIDTTVALGTLYSYQVTSTNTGGESLRSASSNLVIPFVPPSAAQGLTLTPRALNKINVIFQKSNADNLVRLPTNYFLTFCDISGNSISATGFANNSQVNPNVNMLYSFPNSNTAVYAFITTSVTNNNVNSPLSTTSFAGATTSRVGPAISYNAPVLTAMVADASAQVFTFTINNNGNNINIITLIGLPVDAAANIMTIVDTNAALNLSTITPELASTGLTFTRAISGTTETWVYTFNTKISQILGVFGNASGAAKYTNRDSNVFPLQSQ